MLSCRGPCPPSTSARSDVRGLLPSLPVRHVAAAPACPVPLLCPGSRLLPVSKAARAPTGPARPTTIRWWPPYQTISWLLCRQSSSQVQHQPSLRASTTEASTAAAPDLSSPLERRQLQPQHLQQQQQRHPSGSEIEANALRLAVDWTQQHPRGLQVPVHWPAGAMEEAYTRSGIITADYAKTFYLVRS